ncbi:MAG TPA: hypothetical protein VKP61_11935 [Candidatus Acidoferrum sp.]|nr:hypothetical protein [Candidatus Acidoferrum sp.]
MLDAGLIVTCGVLSFLAARRTGQIDIRIALGAQRSAMRSDPSAPSATTDIPP